MTWKILRDSDENSRSDPIADIIRVPPNLPPGVRNLPRKQVLQRCTQPVGRCIQIQGIFLHQNLLSHEHGTCKENIEIIKKRVYIHGRDEFHFRVT